MGLIKNEVAVMFSGGIDSLLASVLLLKEYDKVHLVTFDKGYLEFGVKNNLPNVERLKAAFGEDRVTHQVVDLKKVHKKISVSTFFKDRDKYNTEIRWCVGCRLSMNVGGLLFALENNLVGYADGSNREQIPSEANLTGTAENYPRIVNGSKALAKDYAVRFLTPTYEYGSRENRRTMLTELGFDIDYLSRDESKKLSGLVTKGMSQAVPADVFFRLDGSLEAEPPRQTGRAGRAGDRRLRPAKAGRGRPRCRPGLFRKKRRRH